MPLDRAHLTSGMNCHLPMVPRTSLCMVRAVLDFGDHCCRACTDSPLHDPGGTVHPCSAGWCPCLGGIVSYLIMRHRGCVRATGWSVFCVCSGVCERVCCVCHTSASGRAATPCRFVAAAGYAFTSKSPVVCVDHMLPCTDTVL